VGGSKSFVEVTVNIGGKLFILLAQLRPRIRPLDELLPVLGSGLAAAVALLWYDCSCCVSPASTYTAVASFCLIEAVAVAWLWPSCSLFFCHGTSVVALAVTFFGVTVVAWLWHLWSCYNFLYLAIM
jgi:hypothetical protein